MNSNLIKNDNVDTTMYLNKNNQNKKYIKKYNRKKYTSKNNKEKYNKKSTKKIHNFTKKNLQKKINVLDIFESVENIRDEYRDENAYNYTKQNIEDENKTNSQINKDLVEKLKNQSKNHTKPNSDFYTYTNDVWIKNVKKDFTQNYITQFDDFRTVQDITYYKLRDIIEEEFKTDRKNEKFTKNLKNFYDSTIRFEPVETSKKVLKNIIEEIDIIRSNKDNLWKMLAYLSRIEMIAINTPLYFKIDINEENSKYSCHLYSCEPELLDIQVYVDDGLNVEYKKNYRKHFFDFQDIAYKILIDDHHNLNPVDVFEVQQQLYNSFVCENVKGLKENTNNNKNNNIVFETKIKSDEALTKYKFDWEKFCKELGFKEVPGEFYTNNLNYFACCTKLMIDNWHTEKWRTFWIWLYTKALIRLTDNGAQFYVNFYAIFMRGAKQQVPFAIRSVLFSSCVFSTYLSKKYYEKYYDKNIIDYVTKMSQELLGILYKIIKRNKWLSIDAKEKILDKIKNITFRIGYSDEQLKLIEDPLFEYTSDNLVKNMWLYFNWKIERQMDMIGKDYTDVAMGNMNWQAFPLSPMSNETYLVNAFYVPLKNLIFIPLGYLQKPFIDLEMGLEYNLAQIGFTIAHEISHSLNEYALNLDEKGNLTKSYLSDPKDSLNYKKIVNNIHKQFEVNYKKDKIYFDFGGLDESFADISALTICSEYLRNYHNKNNTIAPVIALSFETFFLYYSIRTRGKVNKKSIDIQIKTNPHPLNKYRCNIPLTRSEVFRAIYNVKKGDGMWWENTDTIW
jgi:predicted metalloendopeptidase